MKTRTLVGKIEAATRLATFFRIASGDVIWFPLSVATPKREAQGFNDTLTVKEWFWQQVVERLGYDPTDNLDAEATESAERAESEVLASGPSDGG